MMLAGEVPSLDAIRDAVARELEARGFSNREFLADLRAGRRDEGPYMIGALAWAQHRPAPESA